MQHEAHLERSLQVQHRGFHGRPLGELVQLGRGAGVVIDRKRRHVRADQQHRRTQRLHHIELALGAIEVAPELCVVDAFELAERDGSILFLDEADSFFINRETPFPAKRRQLTNAGSGSSQRKTGKVWRCSTLRSVRALVLQRQPAAFRDPA